jgi:hypothetical protein
MLSVTPSFTVVAKLYCVSNPNSWCYRCQKEMQELCHRLPLRTGGKRSDKNLNDSITSIIFDHNGHGRRRSSARKMTHYGTSGVTLRVT